jgi:F0F1-type ATP synthase membrane subunit a
MLPITAVTKCLQNTMTRANIGLFLSLVTSFLCVRYEITTRGLSRYCEYSLRQIFRFLVQEQNWLLVRSAFSKVSFIKKKKSTLWQSMKL